MSSIISTDSFDLNSSSIIFEIAKLDAGLPSGSFGITPYYSGSSDRVGFSLTSSNVIYSYKGASTTGDSLADTDMHLYRLDIVSSSLRWSLYNGGSFVVKHTETLTDDEKQLLSSIRAYVSGGAAYAIQVGSVNIVPVSNSGAFLQFF